MTSRIVTVHNAHAPIKDACSDTDKIFCIVRPKNVSCARVFSFIYLILIVCVFIVQNTFFSYCYVHLFIWCVIEIPMLFVFIVGWVVSEILYKIVKNQWKSLIFKKWYIFSGNYAFSEIKLKFGMGFLFFHQKSNPFKSSSESRDHWEQGFLVFFVY